MKQHIRKLSILLFLVSLFISCSPEENFIKNKSAISLQDIKTKHINYNDFNRKTQFVKNKPNISPMISENQMGRLAADTSDYVIYSDKIIETIFNDYTSYTMLLKTPNTTKNVYYNIVLEVRNDNTEVLILKYTKSESGILEETITAYRSSEDFPPGGSIELKMYIEDFDNLGGGGSWGTSTSTGSGGMPWTGLGGSQIYPSNCNGTVTTTYVLEPKKCSENIHWPPTQCNAAQWAYYELVPYYSCVPNPSSGTTNPPTLGGGNTGGPNSPDPEEDTSITAMIKPIECTERLEGDLDGDCQLSTYESCLKDGNSQEVCDCVAAGGNLADCQDEVDCLNLANLMDNNKTNLNHYINQLIIKHNANVENEYSYVFKKTIQYFDPITDEVTYNYLLPTVSTGTANYLQIQQDSKTYSDIHLHTKEQGAASGLFSWGDIYNFGEFYSELTNNEPAATFKEKNDITTVLLAPDPQNQNNYNVYALTVKDATQLNSATQNEWNKWSRYTDIDERMKRINEYFGTKYLENKTRLERFFLDTFSSYGITLYKLENNQWKELTPDASNNNGVTKKPCE